MIKLMQGDCLELMRDLPNDSIDLVVTDPPYSMTHRGRSCRPNYMKDNMGDSLFIGDIPDAHSWMQEIYRVLRQGTHFYTFCNIKDLREYLNAANDVGFKLQNIITMIKDTKMPNRWYLKYTESILMFRKGPAKPINNMTSRDYIHVVMPKAKDGKLHITEKPLNLIEMLVLNSSNPQDTVLDPFMGGGTTGVAAVKAGRSFIGVEIDVDYFNIAQRRIQEAGVL